MGETVSYSYFIVCMECKTGVLLGKAVYTKYKGIENLTYGFENLGLTSEASWKPDPDGCSKLQHFLMLHRNHELRVLPDTVHKYAGDLGVPQSFPCDADDADPEYNKTTFFLSDTGKPDPEKEADELPESVIERLREF